MKHLIIRPVVGVLTAVLAVTALPACGGGESASVEAFCERFAEFEADEQVLTDDDALLDGLRDLRSVAPDDVRADLDSTLAAFETMSDFNTRLDAGEEIDDRDPELVEASARLDQGGANLDAYVTDNCNVVAGS